MGRGRKALPDSLKMKRISATVSAPVYEEYRALLENNILVSPIVDDAIHKAYIKALKASKKNNSKTFVEAQIPGQQKMDGVE